MKMKWLLLLIMIYFINNAENRVVHQQVINKNYKNKKVSQQQRQQKDSSLKLSTSHEESMKDTFKCPEGCLCQYAHFMDLPIARWINHMQQRQSITKHNVNEQAHGPIMKQNYSTLDQSNDNKAVNPLMKQATCMVQEKTNFIKLIASLPLDLKALIILYTGVSNNKTVNSSAFRTLNQLNTLEIRGTPQRTFLFVFDEPLSFLQFANFESIHLIGSDSLKRPKSIKNPGENFEYKPSVYETYEIVDSIDITVSLENKLDFATPAENLHILPYELYMAEVKRTRIPSFYGWQHLKVLRIHDCLLNELNWEIFHALDKLEHLSLERNAIEKIPPFAFYGAIHLKTLSLAHNRIQSLHYHGLAGLLELEWLDLSGNLLNNLSERSFPPFPKLQHIDFRFNPLRHIFPATFLVMNSTETMMFSSKTHALELWGNMPFEALSNLKELIMENVSMPSLQHRIFKDLHSLETLKMRGQVHTIEFDAFADLGVLETLDMGYCALRDLSMDAFLGCRKIKTIYLPYNNLSYIPHGLFDDQKFLEEIYLQGNQLRTLPTTFFLQPKLRIARLHDNPWECDCDMLNWRPKITNQERGPNMKYCVNDFMTGKQIACRQTENYKIVRQYAPRCVNHRGRSVFYVLRKELKCNTQHVIYTQNSQVARKRIPLWRKLEEEKYLKTQLHGDENNRVWLNDEIKRSKIQHAQDTLINSLNWAIYLNPKDNSKKIVSQMETDHEISNTIY